MSIMFKLANRDLFPIKKDAFKLYDSDEIVPGERIYNKGSSCINKRGNNQDQFLYDKAVTRLQYIWEQAILMEIGPK